PLKLSLQPGLTIQGFSSLKGMGLGKYISSGTFSAGGHLWEIQFFPDGKKKNESGDIYVSLFITLVSKFEKDFKVWFEYVLLDQSGDKWYKSTSGFSTMPKDGRKMCGPYTVVNDSNTTMPFGFTPFVKRTELEASQFIKDDCLIIQCTVCVANTSMDSPKPFAQPLPLYDLGQCHKQLLESWGESDFFSLIKIKEMQAPIFKVHKSLSSLIALLYYIYCDDISYVEKTLEGLDSECVDTMMTQYLLAVAGRYGIERLRSVCESRLCENFAVNNVASTLALAEHYGFFELKSRCLEFIGLPENLEAVMQTDEFKYLKEDCPAVIDELLKSVEQLSDHSLVSNGPGIQELERESFSCCRGVAHICSWGKGLLFRFLRIG
ncbi:hypothetical protein RD792_002032, partial [Penstemon davidsonii]